MLGYSKRGGGRPASGKENYLKCSMDMILLVHTEGTAFTCNKRVTVEDTFGHGSEASPSAFQLMHDVEFEGATTDIPMRALHFLINRFVDCAGRTPIVSEDEFFFREVINQHLRKTK